MASTYSSRLRLNEQGTGDGNGQWGAILNAGVIQLSDDAIAGFVTIDVSAGTTTLTANNGATDQARMAFLYATGTNTSINSIVIPSVTKGYWLQNAATSVIRIKCAGGLGVTVSAGSTAFIICDSASVINATSVASQGGFGTAAFRDVGNSTTQIPDTSIADGRYVRPGQVNQFSAANGFSAAVSIGGTLTQTGTSNFTAQANFTAATSTTGIVSATGAITVNGPVSATSFAGDGSRLTNVSAGGAGTNDFVIVQDQQTNGVAGPSYTGGVGWTNVRLQTKVTDTASICSVASNQIILPAGSYEFYAEANTGARNGNSGSNWKSRARLRNITDGSTIIQGTQANFQDMANSGSTYDPAVIVLGGEELVVNLKGQFTLSGTKTLAFQVYGPNTNTTAAGPISSGDVEVYSTIMFRRYSTS